MKKHQIGDLYEELHGYLFTLIKNRLFDGCPADYIEDCLNEVFIIAIHKQNDPKFQRDPRQWLVKTAKYVVDNFNRKNVNRLRFYDYDYDIKNFPYTKDMLEDLAFKIAIEDQILEKIKAQLSPDDRVIYIMRFEQLKTPDEIGKELYMKRNAVSTRITRIKARITKLVKEYTGE